MGWASICLCVRIGILVFANFSAGSASPEPKTAQLGSAIWPDVIFERSRGAGVDMRRDVSARGFDCTSFQPICGSGGSIRDHFPIWGCPPGPALFSLLYLYPPGVAVLCCVLIFVPLCTAALSDVGDGEFYLSQHEI